LLKGNRAGRAKVIPGAENPGSGMSEREWLLDQRNGARGEPARFSPFLLACLKITLRFAMRTPGHRRRVKVFPIVSGHTGPRPAPHFCLNTDCGAETPCL